MTGSNSPVTLSRRALADAVLSPPRGGTESAGELYVINEPVSIVSVTPISARRSVPARSTIPTGTSAERL